MGQNVINADVRVTVCFAKIHVPVWIVTIPATYGRYNAVYKCCAPYLGRERLLCHLAPLVEEQACQHFPFPVHFRLCTLSAALIHVRPCPKSQRTAKKNPSKVQCFKEIQNYHVRLYVSTHTYCIQTTNKMYQGSQTEIGMQAMIFHLTAHLAFGSLDEETSGVTVRQSVVEVYTQECNPMLHAAKHPTTLAIFFPWLESHASPARDLYTTTRNVSLCQVMRSVVFGGSLALGSEEGMLQLHCLRSVEQAAQHQRRPRASGSADEVLNTIQHKRWSTAASYRTWQILLTTPSDSQGLSKVPLVCTETGCSTHLAVETKKGGVLGLR